VPDFGRFQQILTRLLGASALNRAEINLRVFGGCYNLGTVQDVLSRDRNQIRRIEMRKGCVVLSIAILTAAVTLGQEKEQERLKECRSVISEILDIPDGIPQDLLDKAECVVVFPSVKKLAIGIGGSYGRGALICRGGANYSGPWGPPAMYALEGGNIGFQLGAQATDFVLLVMNEKGAKSILTSKVKLGAEASAAAGPKGRSAAAATDVVMKAEILSYSRSKGLFAGVSLEGSTLRSDGGANKNLYGRELNAEDIIRKGAVKAPEEAKSLAALLNKKSPKNRSGSK
jgi:lipid-binding SYLF domain-containing protein